MPDLITGDCDTQSPVKSPNDNKEYKIIHLDNGLRAVLISDLSPSVGGEDDAHHLTNDGDGDGSEDKENELNPIEKLDAASLCISVGSFSDPDDIPGLAHLLQRVVVLGSETYPAENSFVDFIGLNGGTFDAKTHREKTVFHFDVRTKHFRQALDHFTQFFVCPSLNSDCIERELEAIDKEFQQTLSSDDCESRNEQIFTSLAKDGQPIKKFLCGNLETLKTKPSELNIDLHSRLQEFYRRYYSAHYMTLAVQSRKTLDTLESWVREIFSQIPNNNLSVPNFDDFSDPFDTPEFNKIYKLIPVQSDHKLQLTWALPNLIKYYTIKPELYITWLIQHSGEGSILSYLKRNNWASEIDCSNIGYENNSIFSLLKVEINLTKDGLNHIFEVITIIFEYIDMLRRLGPQERIYQEIQTMMQNNFRWREDSSSLSFVQDMCVNLQLYPHKDLITGSRLSLDFDSKVIADIQNALLPEKCNIMILSPTFEKEESIKMYERWFKTPYFVQDVDPDWLKKWKTLEVNPHLHLPDVNKFITKNLEFRDPDLPQTEYPVKILDNSQCRLWYKKDNKFEAPNTKCFFNLISPIVNSSPLNAVLLDIFIDVLTQNLSEAVYPAFIAYLFHGIYGTDSGLVIYIHGYNDKLPILFETILDYIDNFSVKDELVEEVKTRLLEKYYKNVVDSKDLSGEIQSSILQHIYWTSLDKRVTIHEVTSEMLLNFVNNFKSKLFVEGLVQGNVTGKEATALVELVQSKLNHLEIPQNQIPEVRVMQLNESEKYCRVGGFNTDGNSVVSNVYQLECGNTHTKCLMELLINLMREPCVNFLTRQEEFGDSISCGVYKMYYGILGFYIEVQTQTNKFSCSHIDKRIEAFLRDFLTNLETKVPEDEFQSELTSMIRVKRYVEVRLMDEACGNWNEIMSGTYLFDRNKSEVEHLKKITKTELEEWVKEHIVKDKKLRKLSIQIVGAEKIQENQNKNLQLQFDPDVEDDSRFIKDIHNYKQGLMIFPVKRF